MPRKASRAWGPLALLAGALASCPYIPTTSGPGQNGAICTDGAECASGFCVDGVCCDESCEGPCRACDVRGSEGLCTNVPAGEDVRGDCGSGVCGGKCDGQGACRFPGPETSCGERVCDGDSVQEARCDGQGRCAIRNTPCAPYACKNGACLTRCSVPLECAQGATCKVGGVCEARLPNGSPCGAATACASGYCVDNVCCDEPCGGQCEACNLPGFSGTCTPVPAGQNPLNECGTGGLCGATCNGKGACEPAPGGTACEAPSCTGRDAPLLRKTCNGAGSCVDSFVSCGHYACVGGRCLTSCSSDADCKSTAFCEGNACVPKRALGEACTASNQCQSGFCVDGVCCNAACGNPCDSCVSGVPGLCSPMGPGAVPSPSCGAGQSCGQLPSCPTACGANSPCLAGYYCPTDGGACAVRKVTGMPCGADAECVSGHCSDGVCCESDCRGTPCRSCNLPGTVGLCMPLPWGSAGACPGQYACRNDGLCASGSCSDDRDCKPGAYCAGASGCLAANANGASCVRGRECASGHCVDGVCCDGACTMPCEACNLAGSRGSCTPIPVRLDPSGECPGGLACNGARGCFTSCSTFAECEAGHVCQQGACVPGKALGEVCASDVECASSFCADGVCCNERCAGGCRSCKVPGAAGRCLAFDAGTDPESECAGGLTCAGAFADGGTACRTSCIASSDCEKGYICSGGSCVALLANGAPCASGAQCQSGFCADGVCCSSSCSGICEACNFAGNVGACLPMPAGTDPQNECGLNTCNGASGCGSTCTTDAQCAPTSFCNGGACAPRRSDGQACASGNQCLSGHCVDGRCCNGPCSGQCEACNLAGSEGTCTPIASGTDPENECVGGLACNGARSCFTNCSGQPQCEAPYYCQGGTCVPDQPNGQSCTASDQCQSGHCADGRCCNSACSGTCQNCNLVGSEGTCAPYATRTDPENECGLTYCTSSFACLTPCTGDANCKPGAFCNQLVSPATCEPKRSNGQACGANNECQSGNCIDGVCCASACSGQCRRCDVPPAGTCSFSDAGTDPDGECGAYVCDGSGSCRTSCSDNTHCKPTHYCTAGACVPKKTNGQACADGNECLSGHCADSVCCDTACTGSCDVCDKAGFVGQCTVLQLSDNSTGNPSCSPYLCRGSASCPTDCTAQSHCVSTHYCSTGQQCLPKKANGQICSGDSECQSGSCVDGVCCSLTCSGQCRRCDAPVAGKCSFSALGTDPDGECGAYVCDGAGACFTSCLTDAQCKSNWYCDTTTSQCVSKRANGQSCGSNNQCQSGNCVDGVCCDTPCAGPCARCNLAGSVGTCGCIPNGQDPDNECSGSHSCNGMCACN